jgi:pepF/M3 family oligoendopeptidase
LAACLNGVKGWVNTLNEHRGRQDPVHSSLDASRIDRETLEAMTGAMRDSFPMFRRYFKSKAKKLGKDSLPWWDLFAPMGNVDRTFTYEEGKQFIIDNFGAFSPQLADYAKKAFDNNWLDVPPREGKRAGAFCMGVPGKKESRILLNWDGSMDSVSTLAHELGHGFHNECLRDRTLLNTNTPMTLAETASTMCETIVVNAAIQSAADEKEELGLLETALNGDSQVVVDIYSRYLFENEVFDRRKKSELSADELSEIMENAQLETFGEGLDKNYLQKYMWTWKPHYYYSGLSFYNYPYTFGLLFATGLYAIYKQRGDEFVSEYSELLGSTGLGTAAELAKRFNIEIREKDFWQGSLDVIGERIDRYEAL